MEKPRINRFCETAALVNRDLGREPTLVFQMLGADFSDSLTFNRPFAKIKSRKAGAQEVI